MTTTAPPADLQAALRTRLIQSGEYSRVMETLRARLDSVDWQDQVRDLAREQARSTEQPHLGGLIESIEPKALEMIPDEIRREVEGMMREFVKKSVE